MSYRPDITPENTLWVGAWWIGFLGAGAASLLISIPILGYPQRLPGTWHHEAGAVLASSYSWGHQGSSGGQVSSVQIVIKILFAPLGSPAAYFPALLLEPSSWGWWRVLCCFCLLQIPCFGSISRALCFYFPLVCRIPALYCYEGVGGSSAEGWEPQKSIRSRLWENS